MRKRGWEGSLQSAASNSASETGRAFEGDGGQGGAGHGVDIGLGGVVGDSLHGQRGAVGGGLEVTSLEERKRRGGQESESCRCGPRCRA